ncbi:MAG: response regulator transcription factor [Flavobacteriales bacterium]|jgi:two-component system copper resistance phosphate regulon response regulator CusR|nr:response regulator transcription factor [Flavobacteriales bacterium]MBK9699809.1 response regulator transcription factor [Flavobacteriales bacterium]
MENTRILIVEDEPDVLQFIRQGLEEHGFTVDFAYDGECGKKLALSRNYDLIVLDLIIPQLNGLELCRTLRERGLESKVLMLTALGTLDDKLEGFEAGADDYLIKPFEFPELLARVNALLKRTAHTAPAAAAPQNILRVADLEINCDSKRARRGGEEIALTAKEFGLLELLVRNKNRVVSKVEIAEKIWDIHFDRGTNVIEVYINFIRKKVDKGHPVKLLHTVVGMGYVIKDA